MIESKREKGELSGPSTVGQDAGGWFAAWLTTASENGGQPAPKKETKKPRKETGTDAGLGD